LSWWKKALCWRSRPAGWGADARARLQIEAGCCHVLEEDGWIGLDALAGRQRWLAGRPADENLGICWWRLRCLRALENRLLAALAAALRLRLEERENPGTGALWTALGRFMR
jgi:hypothetical protein